MDKRRFLVEYIKNFRQVGAVAPSSRFLAQRMVDHPAFNTAKVIVEYGPGSGVFTDAILTVMRPDAKLVVIEQNPEFYSFLSAKYENNKSVVVLRDSAEHIREIARERGTKTVDIFVSGLPFAAMPKSVSHSILSESAKLLSGNGIFITFQYSLLKKSLFERYFMKLELKREYKNLPPAYVVVCSEPKK